MARKVLLVTTVDWVSTARYAGGFAAAAWAVDVVCPKKAPARLSRYVTACHIYLPLGALSSLRRAIRKAKPNLLVACDDRAVSQRRLGLAVLLDDRPVAERGVGQCVGP